MVAKLNAVVTSGTGYASTMISVDLQNRSVELETLMGRAAEMKKKTDELKEEFEKLASKDTFFTEPQLLLKDAMQSLAEAAYYYRSFYYSEDSEQERVREQVLRQKARAAYGAFQKVSARLASVGT